MKTPTEKAQELYYKVRDYIYTSNAHFAEDDCEKNCALLVATEVKESLQRNTGYAQCVIDLEYWEQVIVELNAM